MPKHGAHPTDKHVGQRLRMRRLMLDMSQTNVADALGLTFQQVQKYEKGANRIGASRLQHISQILQGRWNSSSKESRTNADSIMQRSALCLRNTYQIILPRPRGSASPKPSCRFQTQSCGEPSSILSSRSPTPMISKVPQFFTLAQPIGHSPLDHAPPRPRIVQNP
jgi:transcriptional regulator with XRE-family HTH domain